MKSGGSASSERPVDGTGGDDERRDGCSDGGEGVVRLAPWASHLLRAVAQSYQAEEARYIEWLILCDGVRQLITTLGVKG